MAKAKKAKSATPYVQRLLEDKYVQEHLRNAATRLRQAYGRASRQRGKAVEDKKLYGNLHEAAASIRKAILLLQGRRPQPERRKRKILLIVLAGGGAAVVLGGGGRAKLRGAMGGESGTSASEGAERTASAETSRSHQSEPAAPAT